MRTNRNLQVGPGPFLGIVKNNLDPTYMGILTVDLVRRTASGNRPEAFATDIPCRYMTPFYGITNRATNQNEGYKNAAQSYGMWMVPPDIGTQVIVMLLEGDISQAYWVGCVPDQDMNFMMPGHAATENVTNFGQKAPVSEYNKDIADSSIRDRTKIPKPVHEDIMRHLQRQGLLSDETRGVTTSSARREIPSSVFGISTPGPIDKREGSPKVTVGTSDNTVEVFSSRLGGSTFVMDDGDDKLIRKGSADSEPMEYVNKEAGETGGDPTIPHNDLLRLRTRTGHQILLHNSEDLIYIGNSKGTAWIELTSNGKIDVYAQDSISIHSQEDLNFTADRDINFLAGRNSNFVVGKDYKLTAGSTINNVAGTMFSNSAGENYSVHAGANITQHSNGAATYTASDTMDVLSGGNLALGSPSSVGIEGHGSVKITTDGDYHMKALGNAYHYSVGETNIKSDLALKVTSGNVIAVKATGNLNTQSAATNIKADGIIKLKGSAVEIQPGSDLPTPPDAGAATIPAAPVPTSPVPPLLAGTVARIPQHEPWFEHEHLNPREFTPDKTAVNQEQVSVYAPRAPDTFNRSGMRAGTTGGFNASGTSGVSTSARSGGAAAVINDSRSVTISKKAMARQFAAALKDVAGWEDRERLFAAIACANSESALELLVERAYSGTSNQRIRDNFRATRSLTDSELTALKADPVAFFNFIYGPPGRGDDLGNVFENDGWNFIGRGLIQLTGRGNYQRYGKEAGLVDEDLVDNTTNPFGVTIIADPNLINTDVVTGCRVAAAYLKERYRDFGRGIIGNMRMAIAGTQKGYDLAIDKDNAFYATLDDSWIEPPEVEDAQTAQEYAAGDATETIPEGGVEESPENTPETPPSSDPTYPFIHPDDDGPPIHTFDTGDRRVDYVDRKRRPFHLPASEGEFVVTRTNDQGGVIIIYVFQETDEIWFPYTIAMYEAESGESVPWKDLDNIVRQPV